MSGRRLRDRAKHPATPRELEIVDTVRTLAFATSLLDPLMGYAVQTLHLRLALNSGDRARAALAVAFDAPLSAGVRLD